MEGTCGSCGLPIAAGDTFCGGCGHPAATAAPAAAGPVTTAPPSAATGPVSAVPPAASAGSGWPNYRGRSIPADAVVGQRTLNADYLSYRLRYDKDPEGSFDPVSNRQLILQFFLRWLLFLLVYWLGGLLASIVLLLVGLAVGFDAAVTLWWVGASVVGLLFVCLWLLLPVPAQLSEWKFFVDGQASVAPVTFDHIAWALQQRQTPLDMVQVRRLKLPGGEGRDYLELRRGLFTGFIACFGYGQDLYVGWTFWLRISPGHWLLMLFARLWQTVTRSESELYVKLRYDYARAMREAMHSVAREGVDVATGQARPQGQGTVGTTVQVAVSQIDT